MKEFLKEHGAPVFIGIALMAGLIIFVIGAGSANGVNNRECHERDCPVGMTPFWVKARGWKCLCAQEAK